VVLPGYFRWQINELFTLRVKSSTGSRVLDVDALKYKMDGLRLSKQTISTNDSRLDGTNMISTIDRTETIYTHKTGGKGHRAPHFAAVGRTSFDTPLGWMAITWRDDALAGVVFGHRSRPAAEMALAKCPWMPRGACPSIAGDDLADAPDWAQRLVNGLKRFAAGEPIEFTDVPIAVEHLTPFARKVVAACRRIGWGSVTSYGELAARCGAPGAARAVGSVMARNRYPIVVPCHRVLAAGGRIGGYSAPGGLATKRRLLALEAGPS
jgi:methylated-DNA-[protein]-cysteine S-methyltransferase